jgi:hypothetical protein
MGVKVTAIIAYYRLVRIVRMLRHRRRSAALGDGAVADRLGLQGLGCGLQQGSPVSPATDH